MIEKDEEDVRITALTDRETEHGERRNEPGILFRLRPADSRREENVFLADQSVREYKQWKTVESLSKHGTSSALCPHSASIRSTDCAVSVAPRFKVVMCEHSAESQLHMLTADSLNWTHCCQCFVLNEETTAVIVLLFVLVFPTRGNFVWIRR